MRPQQKDTHSTLSIQAILNPVPDNPNYNGKPILVARKRRGRRALLPKMSSSERGRYYRQKNHAYCNELEHGVDVLDMHVEYLTIVRDLHLQRQLARPHMPAGSLEKIVREYLTLFRNGLNSFVRTQPSSNGNSCLEIPASFMSACMSSDVRFDDFCGVDVILHQWHRYSTYFSAIRVEILNVDITETEHELIVKARNNVKTRFSRETIKNIFPHVLGNEVLIKRLIGEEVVIPNQTLFYFRSDGKVHRLDVTPDYMTALWNVLGNMEDVAFLLGRARIAQSLIGDVDAYRNREASINSSPLTSPLCDRFELLGSNT
ncbi:unnamed protein product [Albugo candida]|uniref:Uncharacterized protein n=1 Tax=Albugo candida TaxID=65357 RepID=A0A024GEH1_9STRA|nr:unnamed protein product [Albugo candida]|eukprot:CCI45173.1 unnamed protein product [Albugo candida]